MAIKRRNPPALHLPKTRSDSSWLAVVDDKGGYVRLDELPPGTDLHQRLRDEERTYRLEGYKGSWDGTSWAFVVAKMKMRLAVGIKAAKPNIKI